MKFNPLYFNNSAKEGDALSLKTPKGNIGNYLFSDIIKVYNSELFSSDRISSNSENFFEKITALNNSTASSDSDNQGINSPVLTLMLVGLFPELQKLFTHDNPISKSEINVLKTGNNLCFQGNISKNSLNEFLLGLLDKFDLGNLSEKNANKDVNKTIRGILNILESGKNLSIKISNTNGSVQINLVNQINSLSNLKDGNSYNAEIITDGNIFKKNIEKLVKSVPEYENEISEGKTINNIYSQGEKYSASVLSQLKNLLANLTDNYYKESTGPAIVDIEIDNSISNVSTILEKQNAQAGNYSEKNNFNQSVPIPKIYDNDQVVSAQGSKITFKNDGFILNIENKNGLIIDPEKVDSKLHKTSQTLNNYQVINDGNNLKTSSEDLDTIEPGTNLTKNAGDSEKVTLTSLGKNNTDEIASNNSKQPVQKNSSLGNMDTIKNLKFFKQTLTNQEIKAENKNPKEKKTIHLDQKSQTFLNKVQEENAPAKIISKNISYKPEFISKSDNSGTIMKDLVAAGKENGPDIKLDPGINLNRESSKIKSSVELSELLRNSVNKTNSDIKLEKQFVKTESDLKNNGQSSNDVQKKLINNSVEFNESKDKKLDLTDESNIKSVEDSKVNDSGRPFKTSELNNETQVKENTKQDSISKNDDLFIKNRKVFNVKLPNDEINKVSEEKSNEIEDNLKTISERKGNEYELKSYKGKDYSILEKIEDNLNPQKIDKLHPDKNENLSDKNVASAIKTDNDAAVKNSVRQGTDKDTVIESGQTNKETLNSQNNSEDNQQDSSQTDKKLNQQNILFTKEISNFTKVVGNNIAVSPDSVKTIKYADIFKEISKFIVDRDKNSITFKLEPETLGKLKITLDIIENSAKVHIEVENEAVKKLVENNITNLFQNLNQNGLTLSHLQVSTSSQDQKQTKQGSPSRKKFNLDKELINNDEEKTRIKNYGYNTYEFLA